MSYIALNASSKLTGVVGVGVTTVPVTAGTGSQFAVGSNHSYVTFQNAAGTKETCKITGQSGDNLTVVRTKSVSWAIGDVIECRPCAEAMADYAVAAQISGSTATAIADADEVGFIDVSASSILAKITWANIKAALNALYLSLSGGTLTGGLIFKAGLNNIASAATVNLSTLGANTAHITGSTNISAFTMASGQVIDLVFDVSVQLAHHATNNNLPGGLSITTLPGDRATYWYDGTTVRCMNYVRVSGNPIYGSLTPPQITADQNDYTPTNGYYASVLRLWSDAARNITGFGLWNDWGRTVFVHNAGAYNLTFKDESASSTASNRFALTGDLVLPPDGVALFQYDPGSTRWRLAGGQPVPTHKSSAKAWINWNGTGTPAVRASYNMDPTTPITDNGTGDYTLNLGTDMASANYCVALGHGSQNGSASLYTLGVSDGEVATHMLAGSLRVRAYQAATLTDFNWLNAVFYGDQA